MTAEPLNIEEKAREAQTTLAVVKRVQELQAMLDAVFPGYRIFIERRDPESNGNLKLDLGHVSGVEQVKTVLREAKRPLKKQDLLSAIRDRGGSMNMDTLTSYLSRYPIFINRGHGIWGLPEKMYSNGTEASIDDDEIPF